MTFASHAACHRLATAMCRIIRNPHLLRGGRVWQWLAAATCSLSLDEAQGLIAWGFPPPLSVDAFGSQDVDFEPVKKPNRIKKVDR